MRFILHSCAGALCCLIVSSCQTPVVRKQPLKASPSVEKEFAAARRSFEAGDLKKAVPRLKKISTQSAESDLADDSLLLLAQAYEKQQLSKDALVTYLGLANSEIASPYEGVALIRAARLHVRFNQFKEARALLEKIENSSSIEKAIQSEALELKAEILLAENRPLDAMEAYVSLANSSSDLRIKEKYRMAAQDLLDTRLTQDDIREVSERSSFGFLRPTAKYRSGLYYADQHQLGNARSAFEEVISLAPGSDLAEKAAAFISQIDARSLVSPKTVGAILPLSGKQQAMGQRALRGIQLGLGIYGRNPSGFRLAVIDSEGNPDIARRGIERLVIEDNVIAAIGGLLSKTASAEAAKAQEFGVPSIMMSQKSGVTETGGFVFRNALTSQMQAATIADVAINRLGAKRFAILFPNDPYGTEFASFFWDAVKTRGGSVTGAQAYDPKETDFRGHIQRLVGTYYVEDRAEEYRLRYKQYLEKNPKRSARQGQAMPEDILPPIVDFDALFIPDNVKAAGQIAPMLAYNDVDNVRLLGTNLWNNPALVTRGQKFVENSVFVDGLFVGDRSFKNADFVRQYKDLYGEEPGLIEAQAYDSGLLLRQLIGAGATSRIELQERLANLKGFSGSLGRLEMSSSRELSRPISVLTVKEGKIGPLENLPQ